MKVLIAGGGTGGHLFPGLALAREFKRIDGSCQILFVGTKRGLETHVVPKAGFPLETISITGLKGVGLIKKAAALARLPLSLAQSLRVILRFSPDLVLGLGGFASGPTVLVASLIGIRTAIHEQNVMPGATTRFLSRFVKRVYVSYKESLSYFRNGLAIWAGNPVRDEFIAPCEQRQGPRQKEVFTVLVFGGSRGAHRINRAVVEALTFLEDIKGELRWIHVTGLQDLTWVKAEFEKSGFEAEIRSFVEEMPGLYREADLVVCRSGATTIAELAASGKPSILVPYPFAAEDHQLLNARMMESRGASVIIEDKALSGERLARMIKELMKDRERLGKMASKAREMARPEAASQIVLDCRRLAGAETR